MGYCLKCLNSKCKNLLLSKEYACSHSHPNPVISWESPSKQAKIGLMDVHYLHSLSIKQNFAI